MSAVLLILLFLLGALLATVGGIIGVVDAFRTSTLWGILALLLPFALLVFCIKFWGQRKWARNSLLMSLLGFLAMVLPISLGGGLAFLSARNTADQDLEDLAIDGEAPASDDATTANDAEGATAETPATTEGEAELFEEALLPGLPTAAEIARAELLPSTDPNERFNEIDKERNDPYAFVPIPPPQKDPPPAPENAGGGLPSPTNQPGGSAQTPQPGGGQGAGSPSAPTELPDLPAPTVIAAQVQVTGVANVDGKSYAIVKAPNEPTSRYVQVGDRIANGAVLVKRIENPSGSSPVVILEERGQEIALPVGSNASPSESATDAATSSTDDVASLPVLPPIQ